MLFNFSFAHLRALVAPAMSDDPNILLSQQPLPLQIKGATREKHNELNRLITSRTRLCLPPHTYTPQLYTLGLSVFCSVYTSFEHEWLHFLEHGKADNARMVAILQIVYVPGLLRHKSLEHELASFMSLAPNVATGEGTSQIVDASSHLIQSSIRSKPHTVLAYAWVMYMALFNGGRMIRDQLLAAPPVFWEYSPIHFEGNEGTRVALTERLQFWYLGDDDGKEMKEDFKKCFDMAADQLTTRERVDVVEEAIRIFEMLREMVGWLDAYTAARRDVSQEARDANAKV